MKKQQFKQAVKKYGKTSQAPDGGHILRVNKMWFDFVNGWALEYDRTRAYTLEDFKSLKV